MKNDRITRAGVENIIWLASRLPHDRQLSTPAAELFITTRRCGAVITRVWRKDLDEAGWELTDGGHRIAALLFEIFLCVSFPGSWVWWVTKEDCRHAVELDAADAGLFVTIPMPTPANPDPNRVIFEAVLRGRHAFGTVTDVATLGEQLLHARHNPESGSGC